MLLLYMSEKDHIHGEYFEQYKCSQTYRSYEDTQRWTFCVHGDSIQDVHLIYARVLLCLRGNFSEIDTVS
jgi:hypothetical protein